MGGTFIAMVCCGDGVGVKENDDGETDESCAGGPVFLGVLHKEHAAS